MMKPTEIAKLFSDYIEEGTTPKGLKVKTFFNHLTHAQKRIVANNVAKAYSSYIQEEKEKEEQKKKMKKEISELKKKAKEFGLTILDN